MESERLRQLSTFGPPQPSTTPDPDTWLARLGELPLLAQPGDRWLYQSGSQVLGVLVSRLVGAPLEVVLRERVLGPLGMDDTGFHAADTARLATAYERKDGQLVVSDPPDGQWSRPPAFPDGGAGLVSSVQDVVAFGRMLMSGGGGLLAPATVAEMTCNQLTPAQRANVWPDFSFLGERGWGLRRFRARGRTVLLGWWVRDDVVQRAFAGSHRRRADSARRRRDGYAGRLRRCAGRGSMRRLTLCGVGMSPQDSNQPRASSTSV